MAPNDICCDADVKDKVIPIDDRPATVTSKNVIGINYIIFIVINQTRLACSSTASHPQLSGHAQIHILIF
jgi:hypothetical protein